ncbi:MAG: hypothetical protein IJI98_09660 [Methanosphaera sp.]|nr:hypothetical protein [Methanosphaera sp.]
MLEFKKISCDTLGVMRDALCSGEDYYMIARERIGDLIASSDVHILNSANSCLLCVAEAVGGPVLVCDMGGWNGFIRSCELFDKKVEYLETDYGLINIEVLGNYLEEHDIKSLYITSLAGYTAQQPLEKIQELCDVHDVVLIIDVSGTLGDEKNRELGDIQVASTGSPKIVNIENGGFICNMTDKIVFNKHLLKSLKADNVTCAGIANEIRKAPEILEKSIQVNRQVKKTLLENEIPVIHPEYNGLNTIIPVSSKKRAKTLAYNMRKRLNMDGNIITTGPNYNRIKKASINIEVKNLNMDTVTASDIACLCEIIIDELKE